MKRKNVVLLAAVAAFSINAGADTVWYRTTGNSNWMTSSNWTGNLLPDGADTAAFPGIMSGGLYGPMFVSMNASQIVNSLSIDTHGVFNLSGGPSSRLDVFEAIDDYVGYSDTPAIHSINVETLNLTRGRINVGANANLAITSRITGQVGKIGPGMLTLTNTSNDINSFQLYEGSVEVYGNALPFYGWAYPLVMSNGTSLVISSNARIERNLKAELAASGAVNIVVKPGVRGDIPNGMWGFNSLNVTGGGTLNLASTEFVQAQGYPRDFTLGVSGGATLKIGHITGDPLLAIDSGRLTFAENYSTGREVRLSTPNSVNTLDTGSCNICVGRIAATGSNITFNKAGYGTLWLTGPGDTPGVATINVNDGNLRTLLGTAAINLAPLAWLSMNDNQTVTTAIRLSTYNKFEMDGFSVTLNGLGIAGDGQLDIEGGKLRLQTGTMSFSGRMNIASGTLELATAGSPNMTNLDVQSTAVLSIQAPKQLNRNGGIGVFGLLELNTPSFGDAPTTSSSPTFLVDNGTISVKQSIDLGARSLATYYTAATLSIDNGKTCTIGGPIIGDGKLVKIGGGSLILSGQNTLTGDITVKEGRLIAAHPRDASGWSFAPGQKMTIESPATLQLGLNAGQNNVLGTGDAPASITALNLYGNLTTAAGTTHNLGALNLYGGLLLGTIIPAAGWANYTLNSKVTAYSDNGGSYFLCPAGVNLRGSIPFEVTESASYSDVRRLEIRTVLADEPGSQGSIQKLGAGTLYLAGANTYSGETKASAGKIVVAPTGRLGSGDVTTEFDGKIIFEPNNVSLQTVRSMNIGSTSFVDLNNNDLKLTNSSYASVRANIQSARGNGDWNGVGLTSSAAKADPRRTLGVMSGADYLGTGATLFRGASVAASDTLVKYTLLGDANFDGMVTSVDFNQFLSGYGRSDATWAMGDFNFDMRVNTVDFNYLAGNFGAPATAVQGLGATVPEPACVTVLALASLCERRRRASK